MTSDFPGSEGWGEPQLYTPSTDSKPWGLACSLSLAKNPVGAQLMSNEDVSVENLPQKGNLCSSSLQGPLSPLTQKHRAWIAFPMC